VVESPERLGFLAETAAAEQAKNALVVQLVDIGLAARG
jgi:hypothetical protein